MDQTLESGAAAAKAIATARAQIGTPYVWGGAKPGGFDCSGLVVYSFASAGIALPRTTALLINVGRPVGSVADLMPGDLVFPDSHHVQIYTGGGKIVEAPETGKNVREVNMWGFWRARRITTPASGVDLNAGTASSAQRFNPLGDATGALSAVGGLLKDVTNPHNWLRLAELICGIGLLIIGLLTMDAVKSTVRGVVSAVA